MTGRRARVQVGLKITREQRAAIVAGRRQGKTAPLLAAEFGITAGWVYGIWRKARLAKRAARRVRRKAAA